MQDPSVYEEPRVVTDLADCYFYHTMDIPGYGHVEGEWDLRDGIRAYLGNVDLKGKRVLEMGTASGFIGFYMERQGAEVIGYDLSEGQDWDVVPFARYDHEDFLRKRKDHIRRINNAYWLSHRALGSHNKMVYGSVYSIPKEIGAVDVSTLGSILLHVRDPFLALQRTLALTRETVIVTDRARLITFPTGIGAYARFLPGKLMGPSIKFLPDWRRCDPKETWWRLSPRIISEFVGVLGFEKRRVTYHFQRFHYRTRGGRTFKLRLRLFTLVAHRSAGRVAS